MPGGWPHAATVYRCPKPTIARVQGDVYAGGTGLVAACDIAVAVDTAHFCLSEREAGPDPRHHQPLRDPRHGRARGASLLPDGRALQRGGGAAHRFRARGGARRASMPRSTEIATRWSAGPEAVKACKTWCTTSPATRSRRTGRRTVAGIADIRASPKAAKACNPSSQKRKPNWLLG
jgi:methylglutaconyl-CoA hydratase